MHCRALEGETLRADEDRWDRGDGTATWVCWEVRPWKTPSGIVGGILIFAEDITHRKRMEEALSDMSRKLIQAQEQERARIGRELHDDINQRLAMLAVELEQLGDDPRTLSEPSTGSPKRGGRDFERRPGPVSRVALLKTGVSRCGGGHEKLAQGVR